MEYAGLATAVLVLHAAFLVYLAVGGFLAWRWPRTIVLHVAVVAWGVGSVVIGYGCPLTWLENWARNRAGQEGLVAGGFIDEYLTGVVYPDRFLVVAQVLVGLLVVVSWWGWWRRRRSARQARRHMARGRRVSP